MKSKILKSRLSASVLALVMILSTMFVAPIAVNAATATLPVCENFENYTGGNPDGADNAAAATAATDPVTGGTNGTCMKIGPNVNYDYRFSSPVKADKVVISYDFLTSNVNFLAYHTLYAENTNYYKTTLGNHDGKLKCNVETKVPDGGIGGGSAYGDTVANKWYRFSVVVDYTNADVTEESCYIDGVLAGNVKYPASDLDNGIILSRIKTRENTSYPNDYICIDNVRIYTINTEKMSAEITNTISEDTDHLEITFDDDLSSTDLAALSTAYITSTSGDELQIGTISSKATNIISVPFEGKLVSNVEYCFNIPGSVKGWLSRGLSDTELYFSLPASSVKTEKFSENFDNYTSGAPTGAEVRGAASFSAKVWDDGVYNTSLSMGNTGTDNNIVEYKKSLGITTGKVELNADWWASDDDKGSQALVVMGANNAAYRLLLTTSGNKIGLSQGANVVTVDTNHCTDFESKTWYNMNAVIDFINGKVHYSVGKVGGTPLTDSVDLPSAITAVNGIGLYSLASAGTDTDIYCDNVYIKTITETPKVEDVKVLNSDGSLSTLGNAKAGTRQLKVAFNSDMDEDTLDGITVEQDGTAIHIAGINYDSSTYTAIINLEHGLASDSEFTFIFQIHMQNKF